MAKSESSRKALHSSASVEHYTPAPIVEAARTVLGGIDLDPASCAFANQVVQAYRYFNKRGLEQEWYGRVFLNCPGGDIGSGHPSRSSQVVWWSKLCDEWASDRVTSAIFVGFSLELLQACQGASALHPLDFPVCVPARRIRFDVAVDDLIPRLLEKIASEQDGRKRAALEKKLAKLEPLRGERVSGDQPTHGNILILLPDLRQLAEQTNSFRKIFSKIGHVSVPEVFCKTQKRSE